MKHRHVLLAEVLGVGAATLAAVAWRATARERRSERDAIAEPPTFDAVATDEVDGQIQEYLWIQRESFRPT